MKKYFVAYRFSGEPPKVLYERIAAVADALRESGVDAYCNLFDQDEHDKRELTARQIMDLAFQKIDDSDGLFVLIASSDKSEGQLMEVGYAFANEKPIIVAAQEEASTYVNEMADLSIRWSDLGDLKNKLRGLKL